MPIDPLADPKKIHPRFRKILEGIRAQVSKDPCAARFKAWQLANFAEQGMGSDSTRERLAAMALGIQAQQIVAEARAAGGTFSTDPESLYPGTR